MWNLLKTRPGSAGIATMRVPSVFVLHYRPQPAALVVIELRRIRRARNVQR
jgi:hypothetical protein